MFLGHYDCKGNRISRRGSFNLEDWGGSVGGGRCIEIYLYPRYLYKNSKRDPTHSLGISGVETAKVLMDKV